ncbi:MULTISPECIES: alpha/beta hydrolase [unclassified Modicisalibacter]|uniref:alpha/beta hydrolase n=1 Tax=unclassified Modicisalibacter TaxID=2679913 RepID=UPI001CCD9131|nr:MULTISPECIES: alpha/beta hydrolase [unclassified Modicisalibacter]MBZ9557070.1 alpha/beta hydrolase [Modicisalibacter sp. R2A 31.J]MBZ9574216.1 alpha/beta hydrolase [Modicisalibacter sp. MOD 31.J]
MSTPPSGVTPTGLDAVLAHLDRLRTLNAQSGNNLAVKRRLLDLYFAADASILDAGCRVEPLLIPTQGRQVIAAERVRPDDVDLASGRRLLYLHGGSWMAGSPASHRPLTARLARACRAEVIAVDYRLAPEAPFPAGLEDCLDAWQWLCDSYPQGRLLLAGDSAGGNLTLACLNVLKQEQRRMPDAAMAFSPATDLNWESDSLHRKARVEAILDPDLLPLISQFYLGPTPAAKTDDPRVSPLEGDLTGLPPTLIQCGEAEILLDDSRRYAEQAQQSGSPVTLSLWDDMPHVFVGFAPLLAPANRALEEIAEFADTHLGT